MAGIRVSHLPSNMNEKHLKTYFSNPKNGGGHVNKILHPLTHNSAVVMFDDASVVGRLLDGRTHTLMGSRIDVDRLPKQIFRTVVVEIEANVSLFILENPQFLDELRFIGEVDIQFKESTQIYFLTGTWYQIEWAQQYLDTLLDACEGEMNQASSNHHVSASVAHRQESYQESYQPDQQEFQIKRPNVPMVKRTDAPNRESQQTTNVSRSQQDQNSARGATAASGNQDSKNRKKNKNMGKSLSGKDADIDPNVAEYRSAENNKYNMEGAEAKPTNDKDIRNELDSDDEDYGREQLRNMTNAFHQYGGFGSDSDNDEDYVDRHVMFSRDTNFSENRGRRQRRHNPVYYPEKTRGLDVSEAALGNMPLDYTFDLTANVKVSVAMGDITKQKTDAIVHPSNANLAVNFSTVSRSIYTAAGQEAQLECQQYLQDNGSLNVAQVIHTSAGGDLHNKVGFILHVNGPFWREDGSERCTHMLICSYLNCMMYADQKLWLQSISSPLINTGAFGFPLDESIQAFFDALLLFSTTADENVHLREISLVCFDQDTAMAAIVILRSLLDCQTTDAAVAATDRYLDRKLRYDFGADSFQILTKNKTNVADKHNVAEAAGNENNDDSGSEESEEENESGDDNADSQNEVSDEESATQKANNDENVSEKTINTNESNELLDKSKDNSEREELDGSKDTVANRLERSLREKSNQPEPEKENNMGAEKSEVKAEDDLKVSNSESDVIEEDISGGVQNLKDASANGVSDTTDKEVQDKSDIKASSESSKKTKDDLENDKGVETDDTDNDKGADTDGTENDKGVDTDDTDYATADETNQKRHSSEHRDDDTDDPRTDSERDDFKQARSKSESDSLDKEWSMVPSLTDSQKNDSKEKSATTEESADADN